MNQQTPRQMKRLAQRDQFDLTKNRAKIVNFVMVKIKMKLRMNRIVKVPLTMCPS